MSRMKNTRIHRNSIHFNKNSLLSLAPWIYVNKPKKLNDTARELPDEGTKARGKGTKTYNECVKIDMKWFGLVKDEAHNPDK